MTRFWLGFSAATPLGRLGQPGKRSRYRIAILDVVQALGGLFGPDEMFGLQSLLRHRNPGVCQKMKWVIMAASPCGLPKSSEALAMMRTFNPYLHLPPNSPKRKTQ